MDLPDILKITIFNDILKIAKTIFLIVAHRNRFKTAFKHYKEIPYTFDMRTTKAYHANRMDISNFWEFSENFQSPIFRFFGDSSRNIDPGTSID